MAVDGDLVFAALPAQQVRYFVSPNTKNPINMPTAAGIASRNGDPDGISRQLQKATVAYAMTVIASRNIQVGLDLKNTLSIFCLCYLSCVV
jgi:hypothetical protein